MQVSNAPINIKAQADAAVARMTAGVKAEDSSATSGSTGASGNSGTSETAITANDFLTLLVTEMQNQDPTANTDPNEYINQLVQVNSLQQLISINQEVGSMGSGGSGSSAARDVAVLSATDASAAPARSVPASASAESVRQIATQLTSARMHTSPAQAMENFAASLHREPATTPSTEATIAASARRVASSL